MKITKSQLEEMKLLRESGKTYEAIGKQLGISKQLVYYNLNDEFRIKQNKNLVNRFKNLTIEQRRVIYRKRNPYVRKWKFDRYHSNEEFRKTTIKRVCICQKRRNELKKKK